MIGYRREIDGLRAFAVLPVILFHAGFGMFSGGFVGVDVFFVISGYLITSVILNEKQAGQFSLLHFYERRTRRILPALFLVMFCCLPFAWWWMLPVDMEKFSRSLAAVPLFVSNILFRKESGYFDTAAELKPLLHTWSLGIEEQYYLLFPLFIVLTWRLGRRWVIAILLIIAIASLSFAQVKVLHKPSVAFYLLPSRGWELLLGALLAFYMNSKQHHGIHNIVQQIGGLIGATLIGYSVLRFDETTPFPGLYALLPTVGAALIILCATPQTLVGKFLGSAPLVGLGLISYSAYLWHQPLFAFARIATAESLSSAMLLALSAASLLLAYLSWKYVERPFRNATIVSRRRLFICAITGSLFFVGLGALGHFTQGYDRYFSTYRLSATEQTTYALLKQHTGGNMYNDMGDDGECNFWTKSIDPQFSKRFQACSTKYGKAVVILGDSHAMNIFNAFYHAGFSRFLVGVSQGECRPHDNAPTCHYDGFDQFLTAHSAQIETLFFHQSGSYLLHDYAGKVNSPDTFAADKTYSIYDANIEKTARYLDRLAQSTKLVWLGPFPEARFDFKSIHKIAASGFAIPPHTLEIFTRLDDNLTQRIAANHHAFSYVSLVKILGITPDFLKQDACITYRDGDHFSICGEKIIGEKIKKSLLRRSK